MCRYNKPLKVLFSTGLGILLVGLVVGIVVTQPVMAGPSPKMDQARLLQVEQTARLIASDGVAGDTFGWSVAVDGDTIAVGAPGDEAGRGSVYVFVKPEGGWRGTLTETARLVPSGGADNSQFGYSVAVNGSTIIIGAIFDNSSKGAAYIFVKPADGWHGTLTETARLTASDGTVWDSFGTAVALSHDTAIVSASKDEVGGKIGQGSAYVFTQPAGGWHGTLTETAKLVASDGAEGDDFGRSAGISGDTVVIGAPVFSANRSGSAYVFIRPSGGWAGTLTETAKLVASDSGGAGDFFGVSAGISGNTIVSGAAFHNSNQGALYIFTEPAGGWHETLTETARLTASDGNWNDRLGVSAGISGDTVVGGADLFDNGKGAAYRFDRPQDGWSGVLTETARLTATEAMANDNFGYAVAVSGSTTAIGAPNSNGSQGVVYVFVTYTPIYLPVVLKNP